MNKWLNKSKNGEEEANLPGRIPDNFCRSCPSRRWASPPRQLWAVLRASFPKARGGRRREGLCRGETRQSGLSQVTGSAQGAVTVTAGTPRQRRDCGLSPLWSPPQSPELSPLWGERHQTDSARGTSCSTPAWSSSKTGGSSERGKSAKLSAEEGRETWRVKASWCPGWGPGTEKDIREKP